MRIVIGKLTDGYLVSCPGGFDVCADLDSVIGSVRQYCERWLEPPDIEAAIKERDEQSREDTAEFLATRIGGLRDIGCKHSEF